MKKIVKIKVTLPRANKKTTSEKPKREMKKHFNATKKLAFSLILLLRRDQNRHFKQKSVNES